jgi:two-component system response regulator PilR (NtrC family)
MLKESSILVADDEEIMREILESVLTREGCRVTLVASGEEAIERAKGQSFDVAIVDFMMPGINGLETLKRLKQVDDDLPVIIITAFGTSGNTREAFKLGAFDFLEKPFKNDDVLVVARNAAAQRSLVTENRTLRQSLRDQGHRFSEIIGGSPEMQRVFDLITQAAPSRTTILVQGESGTGKELAARAIHANSARSDRPFVTVNSGSLPPDLLESNLFGHVKGAFTGAVAPKKGLFEVADKGTIFFDEIGSVPLETQAKLLRVMQEREFMRLGGVDTVTVDVRIVAATNVDLFHMVEEGLFREDLYYRLHVITIELPPLRDRREDVPLLAQHFLEHYGKENGKPDLQLSPKTLRLLEEGQWPGNVRELENVIERAVVLTTGDEIGPDLIPETVRSSRSFRLPNFELPPEGLPFRKIMEEMESALIRRSLDAAGGVQKRAAELLQIKPTTLNEMIKRYGIRSRRRRSPAGSPTTSTQSGSASSRTRSRTA